MTRQQKTWLSLSTAGSLLLAVSWFCWWWLSSGAATVSMAAAAHDGVEEEVSIQAPVGVRVEYSFNDGTQRPLNQPGSLQVRYSSRVLTPDREAMLDFVVTNQSSVVANIGFFITDRSVTLRPGRDHHLTATVDSAVTSDMRASLGLGFHLYGDRGYAGEWAPSSGRVAWHAKPGQAVEATYWGSIVSGESSGANAPKAIGPRVALVNIEPGATVSASLRWNALQIKARLHDLPVKVERLPAPIMSVAPSSAFYLTVRGTGSSLVKEGDEEVLILRGNGGEWLTARAARRWTAQGDVASTWSWLLPADVKPGTYDLLFGIRPEGRERWKPLRSGQGSVPHDEGTVKLGRVKVGAEAGPVMRVGMSFHRYPGRSQQALGPLRLEYDFARSLAADGMSGMEWWRGVDQYEWSMVDRWAAFHAREGRGVIMVFSGSPTWASMRPKEHSSMWIPGYAAPPERRYWPAYGRLVEETVKRLRGKLTAVECWNEPDLIGGFTGTATELADLCKIVSTKTKTSAPEVPVICPQAESAHGLPFVLNARTSEGEPITQFCDYVGAHVYGAMSEDLEGRAYDEHRLHEELWRMQGYLAQFGIDKPLAVTEYGVASCGGRPLNGHKMFSQMSSEAAGVAMFQAIRAFREGGVRLLGLYSYDHEDRDPKCRPGGSFIRSTTSNVFGAQDPDAEVLGKINEARKKFGP